MNKLHQKRNLTYPLLTFTGITFIFFLLWYMIDQDEKTLLFERTQKNTENLAIRLEESINNHLAILDFLRSNWTGQIGQDKQLFESKVQSITEKFAGFQAINYINSDGIITWVHPEEANLPAMGKNLHLHPDAGIFFNYSEQTGQDIATSPITLWQGGRGFATYLPIRAGDTITGYINGVFRADHFIEYSLGSRPGLKDNLIITDGEEIVHSGNRVTDDTNQGITTTQSIHFLNRIWEIRILVVNPKDAPRLTYYHSTILLIGIVFAAAVAIMLSFIMRNRTDLQLNLELLKNSQEELKKRSIQQEQILDTAKRLTASLDLEIVLEQIGINAKALLSAYSCVILMLKEDKRTLEPVVVMSPENKQEIMKAEVDIDSSYSGKAIEAKTSMVFNSRIDDNEGYHVPGTTDPEDTRVIVSPFVIDSEVIGVVCLNRIGKPFDENDRHNAEIFAAYASTAIKNAKTHDKLKQEMDERTKLENQLRQAQKMEAVGQLAGGVAHDFNNKLGGIIGYAELALGNLDDKNNIKEYLELIIDRGEKSAGLVQQLLAFSRQQILRFKTVDLNDLIQNSTKLLVRIIGENITLNTDLQPDLPTLKADVTAIEQIILNISINARDAMPNGGNLNIKTMVVTQPEFANQTENNNPVKNWIKMSIADNGIGISEDMKQHIFEPFFTTKSVHAGTGLGLSMVFGLISQHSAHIECESVPGQGTTFHMYFPESQIEELLSEDGIQDSIRGGNERILLVEDDRNLLEITKATLESLGYEVVAATNGLNGLNQFKEQADQIQVIVSDVVMPSMSGLDMYKQILKVKPGIKVIFITGYGPETMLVKRSRESGTEILQKPFRREELANKLRELLD